MKTKSRITSLISFVLCICIIFGTGIHTKAEIEVDNANYSVYTENEYTNNILDFLACVFSNKESTADGINEVYRIRAPFILAVVWESPYFLGGLKSIIWFGTKVRVINYSGDYTFVEVINNNDDEPTKGYIHRYAIDDDRKGKLTLSRKNDIVYVGKTNSGRLKATYNGDSILTWTVEPEGYIKRDEKTGVITGIKPGIVTVTASAGDFTESCTVSCINQWKESETATAQRNITVRANPGNTYDSKGTIPKGATITASGDLADGSGWIYAEGSSVYGFIQLSDFPGIDYLMTEYHYYDKGYDIRFSSAKSKLYDYTSVLNDKMMNLFGLKICSYIEPYESVADNCKKLRFVSVKTNNLASSCPKNGNHKTDSCLKTDYLRDELKNLFGNGGGTVSKVAWTGHIMSQHEDDRSNATFGVGTIIITPYKTVHATSSGYVNDSDYEIRRDSISTLMHETVHQLGVWDHYCYEDKGGEDGVRCSNKEGCYKCYGNNIKPDCMMMSTKYPTEDDILLCKKCQSKVSEYLSNNF